MENKHPYLENKPPGRNLPIGIKVHENIVRKMSLYHLATLKQSHNKKIIVTLTLSASKNQSESLIISRDMSNQ